MSRDDKTQPDLNSLSISGVLLRYGIYALLVVGSILAIWQLAKHHGDLLFVEDSPLEWAQVVILGVMLFVFLLGAFKSDRLRQVGMILVSLPALALIREQDSALDDLIPAVGWQLPFFLIVIGTAIYSWRHRRVLGEQIRVLVNHRSFALMWSGFIVAIPFAQMIGHGPFMEDVFGDEYHRTMKRLFEECAETLGYLMIFVASIEWMLSIQNQKALLRSRRIGR